MAEEETERAAVTETRTETEPKRSPREAMPSIVIRAELVGFKGQSKQQFWENYRAHLTYIYGAGTPVPADVDQFDSKVRNAFAANLQDRFLSFLQEAYPPGTTDSATETKRRRARQAVRFSVADVWYGSIDIMTVLEHFDQIIDAFSISVDLVTAILSLNAPGALNAALGHEGVEWQVTVPVVDIGNPSSPPPPQQPTDVPSKGLAGLLARLTNPAFAWKLLNALYIVPIAIALFVFISTYREMKDRISAYDTDLLKVKTDEIARASARSDNFDKQHELSLQRQENILKEGTDSIRAVLTDEIKRASARAEYFDQQQAVLLQRYESLSRENTEIIKTLIQKSDACCKPCCDCKNAKDRCQKSSDSK